MPTGLVGACQIRIEANGPQSSGCTSKDSRSIHKVAQEFESLLIEQMLKSAKLGELSEDGNSASGSMMALAQENLARLISQNGGIGMAQFLEKALNQTSGTAAVATAAGSTAPPAAVPAIAGPGATAPLPAAPQLSIPGAAGSPAAVQHTTDKSMRALRPR